ncbi:MAG: hypothetical protein ACTSP6_07650 [Promethearchaeota archaeon]
MEKFPNNNNDIMKKFYKPDFSVLFKKIKGIETPVKNDLLMALLDGEYHSERELIRLAKAQRHLGGYMGAVTLATMMSSLNNMLKSEYVEKRFIDDRLYYKISDNFVGLSRAAYNKFIFNLE